jgi:hypothetical protein
LDRGKDKDRGAISTSKNFPEKYRNEWRRLSFGEISCRIKRTREQYLKLLTESFPIALVITLKNNRDNEVDFKFKELKASIKIRKQPHKSGNGFSWKLEIQADPEIEIQRKRDGDKIKAD